MIPRVGPAIFSVTGVSGVPLVNGTALSRVRFRWPRDLFCTGVMLFAQSGAVADDAGLTLQIEDATFQNLLTDGQGGTFSAPALALHGGAGPGAGAPRSGYRPWSFQQPIAKGDLWFFTVASSNASGEHTVIPWLVLYFDEAYDEDATA